MGILLPRWHPIDVQHGRQHHGRTGELWHTRRRRVEFFRASSLKQLAPPPGLSASLAPEERISSAAGPRTLAPRRLNGPSLFAFCAAVPGTTIHRTSARPTATGTNPTTATTMSGFVLPARFVPEPTGSRSLRVRI